MPKVIHGSTAVIGQPQSITPGLISGVLFQVNNNYYFGFISGVLFQVNNNYYFGFILGVLFQVNNIPLFQLYFRWLCRYRLSVTGISGVLFQVNNIRP